MEALLDNSAVIHTYMMSDKSINVFRISAVLKDDVNPDILQQAYDNIGMLYPLINARIEWSKYQYKIISKLHKTGVAYDNKELLRAVNFSNVNRSAVQVVYRDSRIAAEFFHSITDGTGAMSFFNSLLTEYIRLKYNNLPFEATGKALTAFAESQSTLLEDAFEKHAKLLPSFIARYLGDSKNYKVSHKKQFSFADTYEKTPIKSTVYAISTQNLKLKSKELNCSITELLSAVMFMAVHEYQKQKKGKLRDISIMIPINLRPLFSEHTLRNFSLYATPLLKIKDNDDIESFVKKLHSQIVSSKDIEELQAKMFVAKIADKNPLMRVIPVNFKRRIVQRYYGSFGGKTCMTISNMGKVTLPEAVGPYVRYYDLILSPRYQSPYNCGVVSFGDSLHINITNNGKEELIERCLETLLDSLSLAYDRYYYN